MTVVPHHILEQSFRRSKYKKRAERLANAARQKSLSSLFITFINVALKSDRYQGSRTSAVGEKGASTRFLCCVGGSRSEVPLARLWLTQSPLRLLAPHFVASSCCHGQRGSFLFVSPGQQPQLDVKGFRTSALAEEGLYREKQAPDAQLVWPCLGVSCPLPGSGPLHRRSVPWRVTFSGQL